MKLHLPCLLRRSLLALLASSTLLPVSAELVRTDASLFAPVGMYFDYTFDSKTGAVKFSTIRSFWRDNNVSTTVKDENGNKVSAKKSYEPKYVEALQTSTLVDVSYNAETAKYSSSSHYLAAFFNQVDGEGGDYVRSCSDVDSSGQVITPGVWILSPYGCAETDVFYMRNYGDIYISDSRQQYNYFTPIACENGVIQYRVDAVDYSDRHMVGIISSGKSNYADNVTQVGFGLDVRDSDSFTYTRAYTAYRGGFSSGVHSYAFNNVKDITFSYNRADDVGGLLYGENWSFSVANAENVRFVGNSAGKVGTIGYAAQSSVWSGDHQGGMQFHNVSGEVLFEGNSGPRLFYNVCTQFADVDRLIFRNNDGGFFRGYNAYIAVEMLRCNTISVTGNVAENTEGLFADPTENCSIVFTDCGSVEFLNNVYQCFLFAEESDTVFTNVDSLSFSGNTALDGAVVGHGLTVSGLTGSLSLSGNKATKTKAGTYSALLSSKTDHPGKLTVSAAEGKYAESLAIDSNTAIGAYVNGLVSRAITADRVKRVSLSSNQLVSESTAQLSYMFENILITEADKVNIDNNSVRNTGRITYLAEAVQVSDVDTFSFSGNSLLSDGSGVYKLWENLLINKENGQTKTVTIADNLVNGFVWSYNASTSCEINGAEQVVVRNNMATAADQAASTITYLNGLCSSDTVSLSQCGTVDFVGNVLINKGRGSNKSISRGAALAGVVTLENIEALTFRDNHAYATEDNGFAVGGAAYIQRFAGLASVDAITFESNSAGGENGGFAMESHGGALYVANNASLSDMGSLTMAHNAARGNNVAYGGAAYLWSGALSAERELILRDNIAESGIEGTGCGGALYIHWGAMALSAGRTLSMVGNTVRGGSANGGAVAAYGSGLDISNVGGQVLFSNNVAQATAEEGKARGGALRSDCAITLQNNTDLRFVGNHADAAAGTAEGGAIYSGNSLTFQNNGSLLMRGNYVRQGDAVVLNAVHMSNVLTSYSGDFAIRCNEGQRAEIDDGVQSRYLVLNAKEENSGTILFSGQYTKTDLAALKANYTQEELAASRRIYASSGMSITYGELQVRDGMQLVSGTTFKQAATAQMSLHNAGISATGALTTASVHFSGANELSSATSLAGTVWTLSLGETNTEHAVLTLTGTKASGAITMGALSGISLGFDESLSSGTYKLISFDASKVTWSTLSQTRLSGVCQSRTVGSGTDVRLVTEGNTQTLVFDYVAPDRSATTLTWGGGSGTWQQGVSSAWTGSVKDLTFRNGDSIVFDQGGSVTLVGDVTPASVTVTGSGALSLSGSGRLTGATALTKTGSGSLTISSSNNYTGGTTLNGGTLTVANDSALGSGTVTMLSGTLAGRLTGSAIQASGGHITAELVGNNSITGNNFSLLSVLNNSGTLNLSGSFKADNLELHHCNATRVDISGNLGAAGFAKAAFDEVTVVNGGTVVNSGATVTRGDRTFVLGSNGIATSGGAVDKSTYLLTGRDSVSTAAIHAQSSNASVTMNGGTLTVNDRATVNATGGQVNLAGGTLVGSLTNSSDLSLAVQNASRMEGSLTLSGGVLSLSDTLNVSGMLNLDSATALDLRSYTRAGDYTLVRAAGIAGDISLLSCETSSDKFGYTLSRSGNDLKLLVSRFSENLVWTAPKGTLAGADFASGDTLEILVPTAITLVGEVKQGGVTVDTDKNVTLNVDKKTPGSGISGEGGVTKSGAGMLTMNAGNTYSGGTTLNAGTLKATAVDSFGTGEITVNGGTLDLGSKAVANDIVLSGTATLKGDAKYTGSVTVAGDATLSAKTSYKGMTTIGSGSTLTLAEKVTMAGSIAVDGTLRIRDAKGLTLAKGATLTLDNGGSVNGLLTVGAGSTLVWADGSFAAAPVLKGGTLDLGAENSLTLTGTKAQVTFGDKRVELPGKGVVYTDETLTVNGGTVTLNAVSGYESRIDVAGGTLKLSTGKVTTDNEITVSGNAAVVNGKMHVGDITVNGTLAKGTNITIAAGKTAQLNGAGVMLGTIAGAGTVDVNASIDATAAKITAAHINLNNGTFTNTKGIKLAKGQTLTLGGASLDLGPKGALATAAGSTLVVSGPTSLTGSLTLGGGELVFAGGTLDVDGMLTLSKAMTVKGSGSITYTTLKPFKGDISVLFGGAEVVQEGNTLTITGEEAVGYRLAPAPLDMTPALPPAPVTNPVADAMVQADWGIIDAERAFMGAVNSRHQHASLLDKGRGAAWVSAFGSSVRHGNKGAHHGSDGNIEGAAFGLEHAVSESGSIGLAVGRSKNRISATGVTHLRQETAHVALYGQKQLAHGFTADAAAAWGDTETKLGSASWQQKSAALTARLTHAQQLTDATAFRTFGGLAYEATDTGSIGSAHTGSVQNLRAELGAGATHSAGKAHLYAEAALTGDLVRHNPTADLDGIRANGSNPGRIGLRAAVGGLYEFTDTWSGTASYGIETESRSTSHTLNIGVSKQF